VPLWFTSKFNLVLLRTSPSLHRLQFRAEVALLGFAFQIRVCSTRLRLPNPSSIPNSVIASSPRSVASNVQAAMDYGTCSTCCFRLATTATLPNHRPLIATIGLVITLRILKPDANPLASHSRIVDLTVQSLHWNQWNLPESSKLQSLAVFVFKSRTRVPQNFQATIASHQPKRIAHPITDRN